MNITITSGIDLETGTPRICDIEIRTLDLQNESEVEKVINAVKKLSQTCIRERSDANSLEDGKKRSKANEGFRSYGPQGF